MASRRDFLRLGACGLVGLLALTGCASKYMVPAGGALEMTPRPEMATVVFIRPSVFAGGLHPTIFDERGRFLGDAEASSHFMVQVAPGDHLFTVWAENTGPMRARLLAGRVYFVEVSVRPGWWHTRAHLLAIAPRRPTWPKLRGWLADTRPTIANQAAGQAYLESRAEDVGARMRSAQEALGELDESELEERTLLPEDGIVDPM